ncbi:hypothetical protein RDWZM_005486 [Blomia tropicalis]|uniref:EB domain-containing protein n=1 Tax=Blomia tropicalis TaxID=40697 RepID=A0A9Q0M6C7_BLOTA|nr:hypothetical protein RDWZM_005486 [Blomia tropicalis]
MFSSIRLTSIVIQASIYLVSLTLFTTFAQCNQIILDNDFNVNNDIEQIRTVGDKTLRNKLERRHMEPCTTEPNSTKQNSSCSNNYVCIQSTCRCPLGYGIAKVVNSIDTIQPCVKFSQLKCDKHVQCQDVDENMICTSESMCQCRVGYEIDAKSGYCRKTLKTNYATNIAQIRTANTSLIEAAFKQKGQYFIQNAECRTNSDCNQTSFVYCYRGRCKCWPEFQFISGRNLSPIINNTNNERMDRQETNVEIGDWPNGTIHKWASIMESNPEYGHCVRKLCQVDSQCQTVDNPNLICNNTICECRYNYVMKPDTKICKRYPIRRQSCDLTCRIIGGLFASIFLLTLIYWCFYCCYSVVKNFRNHRMDVPCPESQYLPEIYDFESNDYERYLSSNTLVRNSRTNNPSRFSVNLTTFLRIPFNDDPPSYSQAMADETLPDYDAVMELQQLRKSSSDETKSE